MNIIVLRLNLTKAICRIYVSPDGYKVSKETEDKLTEKGYYLTNCVYNQVPSPDYLNKDILEYIGE
jgi:hypothetical protein